MAWGMGCGLGEGTKKSAPAIKRQYALSVLPINHKIARRSSGKMLGETV